MPTQAFITAKKRGIWFERLLDPVLIEMGFEIIDTDKWDYRRKKGVDRVVRIKGHECNLELKFDEYSESSGNVCVEIAALRQSVSPIWIYGLPRGNQIDIFTMYHKDLAPFAYNWPFKKLVGEFKTPAAIIPIGVFASQSFIHKFKTIDLAPQINQ